MGRYQVSRRAGKQYKLPLQIFFKSDHTIRDRIARRELLKVFYLYISSSRHLEGLVRTRN